MEPASLEERLATDTVGPIDLHPRMRATVTQTRAAARHSGRRHLVTAPKPEAVRLPSHREEAPPIQRDHRSSPAAVSSAPRCRIQQTCADSRVADLDAKAPLCGLRVRGHGSHSTRNPTWPPIVSATTATRGRPGGSPRSFNTPVNPATHASEKRFGGSDRACGKAPARVVGLVGPGRRSSAPRLSRPPETPGPRATAWVCSVIDRSRLLTGRTSPNGVMPGASPSAVWKRMRCFLSAFGERLRVLVHGTVDQLPVPHGPRERDPDWRLWVR